MKIPSRIFLADNNAADRKLFTAAVHEIDHTMICDTVNDGEEAMVYLMDMDNELPGMIFLDLYMPFIDGRKCLAAIKKDTRLQNIPVIIYTAAINEKDAEEMFSLGAHHFISKPNNPLEVYYLLSLALTENWII